MIARWLRPRSASPVLAVETQPAGSGVLVTLPAAPLYPHPLLTQPDPFRDSVHGGSADLSLWPASHVELHYASRVFRGEADALRHLRSVAQSAERASAVVRLVRREAQAQGVLTRATGIES